MSRESKKRDNNRNSEKRDSRRDSHRDSRRDSRRESEKSYYSLDELEQSSESRDKYKKMAKKLSQDKSELKEKLRKVLDDLENKTKTHRSELEKTQDYFQNQILELTERNNQLKSELSRKDNKKELQTIKRLETTITTLQERLNSQTQELEQYKENLGQITEEKEDELKRLISDLQNQLRVSKEQEIKIKKEFQNIINACEKEKQFISEKMRLEKETEINRINQEKINAIRMIEMDKDFLEKKTKEAEQRREKELNELKLSLEKSKRENELKTQNGLENFKKTMESMQQDFEGKLFEVKRLNSIDVENIKKDCEVKINLNNIENSQKMEALALSLGKEHERIKKERDQAVLQMEKNFQEYLKKEDELNRKHEQEISKLTQTLTDKFDLKEKDYNNLKLKYEKQMGESIEINQKLQQEINLHKLNIKKLQDNSQHLNSQFITNLNKQKENAEKEIFERDKLISKLDSDLKRIVSESVEKLNDYEKRINKSEEELKERKEKCEEFKNQNDKLSESLEKHKDIMNKMGDRIKILVSEKEQADRRIKSLSEDYNIAESDRIKLKADLVKLEQTEIKNKELLEENKILNDSLSTLRKQHVEITNDLNSEKHQTKQNENAIKQLKINVSILSEELDNKMKALEIFKKDCENLTKQNTTLSDEYSRLRATLLEDARSKMNEMKGEYTKKIEVLEKRTSQLEMERTKMTDRIIALSSEKDKLSMQLEACNKPNPDYLAKVEENKVLVEENKNLKVNLIQLQNEFNVKNIRAEEEYKNRVASINKKVLEQDELIKNQNGKLELLKQQYTAQIIEAKQSIPDLLRKTTQERDLLKKQLETTEQNLIKLQLDFANVISETKLQTENIKKKEAELEMLERNLKNTPPKLMDPALKKQKDEALANLRQSKVEISRLRDELNKATIKIKSLESSLPKDSLQEQKKE